MFIEKFLTEHNIWLDAFTAFGTVGATVVAVILAIAAARLSKREILSGLAIVDVDPCGTAYLTNTTNTELRFSVYKNEDLIDCKMQNAAYRQLLRLSELKDCNWNPWQERMVLSPGERVALHLKDLVAEDTFVALAAVKVILLRRTRYWVFRYAGVKARESELTKDATHPHLKWVLEFSAIE